MTWERVRDGFWATEGGATIKKVNPRGRVFYALEIPGNRRPTWHDSLEEAKAHAR